MNAELHRQLSEIADRKRRIHRGQPQLRLVSSSSPIPDAVERPPSWIGRMTAGPNADAHCSAYVRHLCGVQSRTPATALIIAATARAFDVRPQDIMSVKRTARNIRPRHIAMYLAREMTGSSFPEIGRRFGDRDHTTIMHAHKKIGSMLSEPDIARKILVIRADIEANSRSQS